jgi:hypothetical protein
MAALDAERFLAEHGAAVPAAQDAVILKVGG